jgi:large subunit ribosomal protein L37Ae
MVRTKKVKSAGRFGARYGRSVRTKITEIESLQRKKQDCIFCNGVATRLSKGIWQCKKCNKKFASHAYFLPKREE